MTRIKGHQGVVHYRHPAKPYMTLCGACAENKHPDFFRDEYVPWPEAAERVTCPNCAKVVCAVRNEPYNTLVTDIDEATLDRGIYAAVQPDGPVQEVEP